MKNFPLEEDSLQLLQCLLWKFFIPYSIFDKSFWQAKYKNQELRKYEYPAARCQICFYRNFFYLILTWQWLSEFINFANVPLIFFICNRIRHISYFHSVKLRNYWNIKKKKRMNAKWRKVRLWEKFVNFSKAGKRKTFSIFLRLLWLYSSFFSLLRLSKGIKLLIMLTGSEKDFQVWISTRSSAFTTFSFLMIFSVSFIYFLREICLQTKHGCEKNNKYFKKVLHHLKIIFNTFFNFLLQ